MAQMIDKCILLLCCSVFFFLQSSTSILPIFIFICGISVSCLNWYFHTRTFIAASTILYILLCYLFPGFCILLPLILYDSFEAKLYPVLSAGLAVYLLRLISDNGIHTIAVGCFCILGFLLCFRTKTFSSLSQEFKRVRDTGQELNLMLARKNKNLLEKQDYEVHLATLKERNRIAREIHDNVGHLLSRSILQTGAIMTINRQETLDDPIRRLNTTLSDAMTSIRTSVHDLHDESIDLYSSICSILKDCTSYRQNLDYDLTEPIPQNIKYCVITILKEGISNIMKHSNATCIDISVMEHPSFYQLILSDNGTICHVKKDSGMGLENMQERVTALHGTFRLTTENGFKIFISMPKLDTNI